MLAIIGIGCLFPGSRDLAGFWASIVNKVDAIREVPSTHWRKADYFDPDPDAPDKVYAARGGFLDAVDFDPRAFGIAPVDLEATDSSQLLGMYVARQALADCGYAIGNAPSAKVIDRSRISVILGVTGTLELVIPLGARLGHPHWRRALRDAGVDEATADDVVQRISESYVPWQENSFPGLLGNVVAGRIANRFDLGGTNCVVDAACASSLGAIHLAAMELATGRADVVLSGGIDTFNDIFMFTCFSKTPALSPTGSSRPFDAAGDGTVLGEGLGVVVLKRLDDARRDGDHIYAALRGIGSSSDGKGNAIYAPKKEGQMEALRNAYRLSGVSPATVELVEAHGTGTKVGDATEVSALAQVFREASQPGQNSPWCAVGSIKSQIGHTKAAAGAAGLLKAVAALHHKVLPPTIKVQQPLDVLTAPDCPLYVNTEKRPWMPSPDHPRRAALSAFGFGGSNFHAVLEEADPVKSAIDWTGEVQIVAFCAGSAAELQRQMADFPKNLAWPDLCGRAQQTRQAFRVESAHRALLVFVLKNGEATEAARFDGSGPAVGDLAVLFPGQGSQSVGMMRDLVCHFPPAFDTFAAAGPGLVDVVYPVPAFTQEARAAQEETLRATNNAQPALGAVSLGAWRVLQAFGVRAAAFAGHSYGELTALCAAGRLGESDFFALSRLRGRLMADAGRGDAGGMLAVKASEDEIRRVLDGEGISLTLANKNSPTQTVLSGTIREIERASRAFAARKVSATRLTVAAAFHSPQIAAASRPFSEALRGVAIPPGQAVYANSTAALYPDDADAARELLANQLARPVEWARLMEGMYAAGVRDFLEVGPGGRLGGLVEATLQGRDARAQALDRSGGNGFLDLACCLAWLAARGRAVRLADWAPVPQTEKPSSKPGLTVQLAGANYVKPRTPRPATPPVAKVAISNGPPMTSPTPESNAVLRALETTRETLAAVQQMQERTAQLHRQFLEGQDQAHRTVAQLVEQQARLVAASLGMPLPQMPAPVAPPPLPAPAPPPPPPPPLPVVQPAPVRPPVAIAPTPVAIVAGARVEKTLLEVIAEKTGYPSDMLDMGMTLDSDLGIDSIKRVEILSALQERLPEAPTVKPEHLGTLHTLRDIAGFLAGGDSPPPGTNGQAPAAMPTNRVSGVLLEVIAEKTGYPADMLDMGMTLDSDLGIDSIKRVEILSALQERLPEAPTVKPEHLGTLHTLRDIAGFLGGSARPEESRPPPAVSPQPREPLPTLERSIVHAVPSSADRRSLPLPAGEVWVLDQPALAQLLARGTIPARSVSADQPTPERLAALVLVAPAEKVTPDWLRSALLLVKRVGPALRKSHGVLLTVARMDGAFGLGDGCPTREPLDGALAGLAKTVGHEWPEVRARAVDIATSIEPQAVATLLAAELTLDGPNEIGHLASQPQTLERVVQPLAPGSAIPIQPGEVAVISGGARGVTAECAIALARRFRPHLVLLGRSPEPSPEPAWLATLADESAIKRELARRTPGASPRSIGEETQKLLGQREVRRNLERIRTAGSEVTYRAVDIRDAAAVSQVLSEVRQQFGPIRCLIHGAGVLADARIEDKTAEQFDAVFQTKVGGLQALLAGVGDDLRAMALFSSSTARFGRVAQVDYAMANEALNKLAWQEQRRRPNCRVVALNWGPWDGGMVTPGLKQLFAREGVDVIGLTAGAELLATELTHATGPTEVVVLAASSAEPVGQRTQTPPVSPALPLAFERPLSLTDFPVLADHVLDGRPVVPVVLLLEWLAHAAMVKTPGLTFLGCDDLRVYQALTLGEPAVLRVGAAKAVKREGLFIAAAEVRTVRPDGRETLHTRADIVMGNLIPPAPLPHPVPTLSAYPHDSTEVYERGLLFHGPAFQGLTAVQGCGEAGIQGQTRSAPPVARWMHQPLRQQWLSDPLVIDAALQLIILWSHEQRDAGCLPCHIRSYRQYRRTFPTDGTRIVVRVTRASNLQVLADVDFVDREGKLIARMEGSESVIDAALTGAFTRNTSS